MWRWPLIRRNFFSARDEDAMSLVLAGSAPAIMVLRELTLIEQ